MGNSHRDSPISMVVLHAFRGSEGDAGGWVGQIWQFHRAVIIEQPRISIEFNLNDQDRLSA